MGMKPIIPATLQAALARLTGRRHDVAQTAPDDTAIDRTASALAWVAPSPALSRASGTSPACDTWPILAAPIPSASQLAASGLLPAAPQLDPSVLAELRRVFNPDQFDSYLDDALDDIPHRMGRLTERLAAGELRVATQEA